MLIQQLNRTDPEKVQLVVKNVDGSGSLTTGFGVALAVATGSSDGVSAVKGQAAINTTFIGVASQDIAINAFGLVTAWGFAASVAVSQSVGSWTITAGDTLVISATQVGTFTSVVTPQSLSTQLYRYVVAAGGLADTISNPRPYISGIVRGL
jgi:hypothetical protein